MSASKVKLTLRSDNAAAELLVIDGDFKLVAHGPPPLTAQLDPGIYSLKAKIGAVTSERLEVLEPNEGGYDFTLEAPAFESAMPLTQTQTNREYQQNSVEQFTNQDTPQVSLGAGSEIVIYIRDTSRRNFDGTAEQKKIYADGFKGFRLLDRTGQLLVNFDEHAVHHVDMGYAGAQVRVAPGHYVLAWKYPHEEQVCFSLHAVLGWSLQVYLRLQPVGGRARHMRPDFADAAFAYDQIGRAYSAQRADHREMEAVRLALLDRRNLVSGDMLRSILSDKYENPMLGIYGGHLLVANAPVDLDLLTRVIENTMNLVGSLFPDLVALIWAQEVHSGKRTLHYGDEPWSTVLAKLPGPPLLIQSWDLLCKCADANAVDIETLPVFQAAGNVRPSGIFLTWQQREARAAPPPPAAAAPAAPSVPASASPPPPSRGPSAFGKIGKAIWNGVVKRISTQSDGSVASHLRVDIKSEEITTPQQAAAALKALQPKAGWPRLLKGIYSNRSALQDFTSFTALQYDLICTLARSSTDPEILAAIDESYIESLMRAHRVPLQTVARSLRALDMLAVSTEFIRRFKTAAKSIPSKAP